MDDGLDLLPLANRRRRSHLIVLFVVLISGSFFACIKIMDSSLSRCFFFIVQCVCVCVCAPSQQEEEEEQDSLNFWYSLLCIFFYQLSIIYICGKHLKLMLFCVCVCERSLLANAILKSIEIKVCYFSSDIFLNN